jgi:hypothetical protein
MNRINKLLVSIVAGLLIILIAAPACLANSAEPPSITILVANPPEDLELVLTLGDQEIEPRVDNKILESYYSFYSSGIRYDGDYLITMTLAGNKSKVSIEEPPQKYNNIYTLDWQEQTLAPGKAPLRSVKLVGLRVLSTLLIEAFVFLLFGFREYKSWTMFLFINLITQGALNVWLGFQPLYSYIIFSLILGELLVFAAELISFPRLIKEKGTVQTIFYVLLANSLSLVAGGYLISRLPL